MGQDIRHTGARPVIPRAVSPLRRVHRGVPRCLLAIAIVCLTASTPVEDRAALAQSGGRPNIVVIMTDDLDATSLNRLVAAGLMPNLVTYILSRGTTFSNSFVTNPLCCPSRASFLTGQYSHNHGVRTNYDPGGGVRALDDSSTLATWLREDGAGYRTSFVGKYLNGYGAADVNRDGSADGRDIEYVPPGWDDWQALFDPSVYRMYHYAVNDNRAFAVYGAAPEEYQTDVLATRAVRFIDSSEALDDAKPFLLTVMPTAPHVEVSDTFTLKQYSDVWRFTIRPALRHAGRVNLPMSLPPSFNEADVSDKPPWVRDNRPVMSDVDQEYLRQKYRARLESMLAVDDMIGTIAGALSRTGELNNTFLIFTSDNGYQLGAHRLAEKIDPYEESVRVPLYVAGPGVRRQTLSQMVTNVDLAPTIADLAGRTPGLPVDGRSFKALLQDGALPWRKRFLIEHWDALDSTLCMRVPDRCAILEVPSYSAVRTAGTAPYVPSQVYIEYVEGTVEFYDLATDPHQMTSLHQDVSEARMFQRSVHVQWLTALKNCSLGSCQTYEFR